MPRLRSEWGLGTRLSTGMSAMPAAHLSLKHSATVKQKLDTELECFSTEPTFDVVNFQRSSELLPFGRYKGHFEVI